MCRLGALLLVSKRWQRVLLAEPRPWQSVWATFHPQEGRDEETQASVARLLQLVQRTGRHISAIYLSEDGHCTAASQRLPQLLRCLSPERLREADLWMPVSGAAAHELHRLLAQRLESLSIGSCEGNLPPNAAAVASQLAALQTLYLSASTLPPELLAASGGLPRLSCLQLNSFEPLPDTAPLTALSGLTLLEYSEFKSTSEGLRLLPSACFPHLACLGVCARAIKASRARVCAEAAVLAAGNVRCGSCIRVCPRSHCLQMPNGQRCHFLHEVFFDSQNVKMQREEEEEEAVACLTLQHGELDEGGPSCTAS